MLFIWLKLPKFSCEWEISAMECHSKEPQWESGEPGGKAAIFFAPIQKRAIIITQATIADEYVICLRHDKLGDRAQYSTLKKYFH